jgi:hypothetical protein
VQLLALLWGLWGLMRHWSLQLPQLLQLVAQQQVPAFFSPDLTQADQAEHLLGLGELWV